MGEKPDHYPGQERGRWSELSAALAVVLSIRKNSDRHQALYDVPYLDRHLDRCDDRRLCPLSFGPAKCSLKPANCGAGLAPSLGFGSQAGPGVQARKASRGGLRVYSQILLSRYARAMPSTGDADQARGRPSAGALKCSSRRQAIEVFLLGR